jgi:hypothetical protein
MQIVQLPRSFAKQSYYLWGGFSPFQAAYDPRILSLSSPRRSRAPDPQYAMAKSIFPDAAQSLLISVVREVPYKNFIKPVPSKRCKRLSAAGEKLLRPDQETEGRDGAKADPSPCRRPESSSATDTGGILCCHLVDHRTSDLNDRGKLLSDSLRNRCALPNTQPHSLSSPFIFNSQSASGGHFFLPNSFVILIALGLKYESLSPPLRM